MRKRTRRFGKYSPTFKRNVGGVYYLLLDDKLVYVGQSGNIWRRIGEHIYEGRIQFDQWFYQEISNPVDRAIKETELITTYRPTQNRPHAGGRPRSSTNSNAPSNGH